MGGASLPGQRDAHLAMKNLSLWFTWSAFLMGFSAYKETEWLTSLVTQ